MIGSDTIHSRPWRLGCIACCIIGALFGLSCDKSNPVAHPPPSDKLLVVASVYPLASIAQQVGGDRVAVSWWIESGQALAGYQPTSDQTEQLRRATAVLTNGSAEAPSTDQFSSAFGDRRVIRLDAFSKVEFAESQHWLDTSTARQAARALADRLSSLDHKSAAAFRENLARVETELTELSAFGSQVLPGLRGAVVASIGKDYSALGGEFGFVVASLSRDPAVSFDQDRLAELSRAVRQRQALLLLVEADTPAAVLTNLQNSVPVPVVRIDSLGSSSAQGRNTYEKLMRYNYEQLAAGLRQARGL